MLVLLLKCIVTGNCLDSTVNMGGFILNNLLFSTNSSTRNVADIITSFKEFFLLFRSGTIRDNSPIKISVYTLRSCASSKIIMEYFVSKKS